MTVLNSFYWVFFDCKVLILNIIDDKFNMFCSFMPNKCCILVTFAILKFKWVYQNIIFQHIWKGFCVCIAWCIHVYSSTRNPWTRHFCQFCFWVLLFYPSQSASAHLESDDKNSMWTFLKPWRFSATFLDFFLHLLVKVVHFITINNQS